MKNQADKNHIEFKVNHNYKAINAYNNLLVTSSLLIQETNLYNIKNLKKVYNYFCCLYLYYTKIKHQ